MSFNSNTEALIGKRSDPSELLAMMRKKKEEYQGFPRFTALIYGSYGVGKTVLAVQTLIDIEKAKGTNGKVLIVETKAGSLSLKAWPELNERVERIQFENFFQIQTLAACIATKQQGFEEFCGMVVDEWTDAVLVETRRLHDTRVQNNLMTKSEREAGQDYIGSAISWPTFNVVANSVRDVLSKTMRMNLNVILTGHEKARMSDSKIVGIELNIQEAAQAETIGSVNCALRLERQAQRAGVNSDINYTRTLRANSAGFEIAKTSIPLPDIFPAEHFSHYLVEYLRNPEQAQRNLQENNTQQTETETVTEPVTEDPFSAFSV